MVTSTSLASPPSPSRAIHSGVSVLEHLGDAEITNNNNSIGTAAVSEAPPSSGDATTNLNDHPQLGGSITTPAYALLVGVALENESKLLSIPLTSLPTTFGKEHDTKQRKCHQMILFDCHRCNKLIHYHRMDSLQWNAPDEKSLWGVEY